MAFETISSEKTNVHPLIESYSLNMTFVADAVMPLGTVVKLKTDGEVGKVAAATDLPLGVVVTPNKAIGGKVTVQTNFCVHKLVTAGEDIDAGDLLSVTGHETDGTPTVAVAGPADVVYGIALGAFLNNATGYMGVYRMPYALPAAP
jgi:hypothetical protein